MRVGIFPCTAIVHIAGIVVGVRSGNRLSPAPQSKALLEVRRGSVSDDVLMNAAMMFNTLVRDGSAIECGDDENKGFAGLY